MLKEVVDLKSNANEGASSKQSDFSIDHILNRAGNVNLRCDTIRPRINLSDECNEFKHNFTNECLPMFSWLNYTRYKPPKFSSKFFAAIQEIFKLKI